jgi:hypothetical protein
VADAEEDVPLEPAGRASEWSFEWRGLVPLVAIVVVAIVGWRVIGGGGSDADDDRADDVAAVTTTERVVTTTTTVPVTTAAPTTVPVTTTTEPPEPTVNIVGEMKPCRFGDNCLVASFTIEGFDDPPDTFTCIYPNSQRDFSFQDGGKDDACITADEGDTIAIEVGGVTSATISEEDLDGE